MSLKITIVALMILAFTVCDLVFFQQNPSPPVFTLKQTRPCYQTFEAGECFGLTPQAIACVWKPGASHGWCVYMNNNEYFNTFDWS
jgi:hypothetical protein